jgi:hypothetical protein
LEQSRITFGQLVKTEQLQKVYDVLPGARNVTTGELLLAIKGKLFLIIFNNFQRISHLLQGFHEISWNFGLSILHSFKTRG